MIRSILLVLLLVTLGVVLLRNVEIKKQLESELAKKRATCVEYEERELVQYQVDLINKKITCTYRGIIR